MYKKTSANHGNRLAKKEEKFNDLMSIYWPNLPFYNDTIWPGKKVQMYQNRNGSMVLSLNFIAKLYTIYFIRILYLQKEIALRGHWINKDIYTALLSVLFFQQKVTVFQIFFHFSFILYASIYYNWKCRETD